MPQAEMINIMILLVMTVGVVVLVICFVLMKGKSEYNNNLMVEQYIKIEQELKEKINEADQMLKELNQFSSYLQSELENKHKELLFLYQLIEEKEKRYTSSSVEEHNEQIYDTEEKKLDVQASSNLNNKYYKDIIELHKAGKDTLGIAKQLNIGKGEVELILGLAKIK